MVAFSKRRLVAVLALLPAVLASGTAYATHVRPRGATPKYDPLVIAYRPCAQVNTVHGGPATSPLTGKASCTPGKSSPFLTTGTPDVNGVAAQMIGSVRQVVVTSPSPSDTHSRSFQTWPKRGPNMPSGFIGSNSIGRVPSTSSDAFLRSIQMWRWLTSAWPAYC